MRNSPAAGSAEEFDVLDALLQLVEDGDPALEQRATVLRRLDALWAAIEERHAERCSMSAIALEIAGCVIASLRGLRHAARLRPRRGGCGGPQLEPASDATLPMHP